MEIIEHDNKTNLASIRFVPTFEGNFELINQVKTKKTVLLIAEIITQKTGEKEALNHSSLVAVAKQKYRYTISSIMS